MIQANELRHGNKLLFLGEIVTFKNITQFRDDGVFWIKTIERNDEYKSFHFKPIELSEEILLKCGVKIKTYFDNDGEKMILIKTDFFEIKASYIQLDYLHEIQNFVFSNAKIELNVNI